MKITEKKNIDWLETLMNLSGTTLPLIKSDIKKIKADYSKKNSNAAPEHIAEHVSKEIITKTIVKAGTVGGLTSVPASIPGIGTIGTILLGASTDLVYLIKVHIELCYAISSAYDVEMDDDELKSATLAILGFTGSTQALKGISAGMLKRSIDDMAEVYLKKGVRKSSVEVAEKVLPRLLGKSYKIIPFLGIPIGATINAFSTYMVGRRAREYFSQSKNESQITSDKLRKTGSESS